MKKRILALLLALAMTFVLCACGGDDGDDGDKGPGGGSTSDNGGVIITDDDISECAKEYVDAVYSGDGDDAQAVSYKVLFDLQYEAGVLSKDEYKSMLETYELDTWCSMHQEEAAEDYGDDWSYTIEDVSIKELSEKHIDDQNNDDFYEGVEVRAGWDVECTIHFTGSNGNGYETESMLIYNIDGHLYVLC